MQYRKLPHGTERFSVIGMGMGSIHEQNSEEEIEQAVRLAIDHGINYFDMAAPSMKPYIAYAHAFEELPLIRIPCFEEAPRPAKKPSGIEITIAHGQETTRAESPL